MRNKPLSWQASEIEGKGGNSNCIIVLSVGVIPRCSCCEGYEVIVFQPSVHLKPAECTIMPFREPALKREDPSFQIPAQF